MSASELIGIVGGIHLLGLYDQRLRLLVTVSHPELLLVTRFMTLLHQPFPIAACILKVPRESLLLRAHRTETSVIVLTITRRASHLL